MQPPVLTSGTTPGPTSGPRRILCVAYGGGHMRMLIPVAQDLAARGHEVALLPLTVARRDADRSGLPVVTLDGLTRDWPDRAALDDLGRSLVRGSDHPALSDAEAWVYHGLSLADLIAEQGESDARAAFAARGRRAFHPVASWRRILDQLGPDLVITTNSPRSESAALAAARALNRRSLCVTDHFLVYEIDYVSTPGHGDLITVLGQGIGDFLTRHGRPAEQIRVTGNPAFDSVGAPDLPAKAAQWRRDAGWQDKRVILWPQQSKATQVGGKGLIPPVQIAPHLFTALNADPGLRLLVRPHPNAPGGGFVSDDPRVRLDPDTGIEVLIHASDVLVQQSTTVGIQAAMCGKPVITIANQGMPPFAEYGLATDIAGPADLPQALAHPVPPVLEQLQMPAPGGSAARIADVAAELLAW